MKLSNLLYAGMLSSLALVSCTDNDENSEWTGSEGVVFTTSIQSRVSGNSWNANDEVGIFMTPNGSEIASATAANKKYLAQTNGSLVAAPGEGVYLPATGKVDFIAYYPYSNALSGNVMDVNVADQSKPGAIDLLYSNETKGVEAANGKTIALKFVRKMSKITLDMTKDETIESFEGLKVEMKGIATEGKFDLANGTVKATDGKNTQAVAMNIGNVEASTAKATAIILPTATATDQTKMDLTFTLAGKTFTHSIADLAAFEAGKNVTFKATLSVNNGKPVVTVGNATIEDWVGVAGGDFDVNFDGEGGGTQPGEEKVLLDESFATSQGAFTIEDKTLPAELTYVWKWSQLKDKNTQEVKDSYMKASAHVEKPTPVDYATESWLISPELDLTTATTATLTFDHAINFAKDMQTQQTLWVKEVGTENWQQVTIATYPGGKDWKFVSSGNIDLSAQKGKKVQLGFKYVSTDQGAATWEIKNVKVVADGKGGTVDPTPEPEPAPQPGEEKVFFTETFGSEILAKPYPKIAAYTKWDNATLTFADATGNADVRAVAHKTESNTSETAKVNHVWFPAGKDSKLTISGFNAAGYSRFKLSYEVAANVYNKDTQLDLNVLKVSLNGQNVTIPSKVVSQANNETNVFFPVEVTIDAVGTAETVLEFSASTAENTQGLRAYNIKLVGLPN